MPPETGAYLILGLIAAIVILGGFIASMIFRHRNLDRDMDLIRQLRDTD
jgi:hypothetical protein